jgi:beta-ureidopropionase
MEEGDKTRRDFLKKSAFATGAAAMSPFVTGNDHSDGKVNMNRLPREVWVASITMGDFEPESYQENIELLLDRMKEVVPYQPDIVCLPEVAPFMKLKKRPPIAEVAEEGIGPITSRFAAFARKNNCYVIIPLYTKENGRYYNAAVLLDRKGNYVGEYRKIYPTVGNMEKGITPGPIDPPVFKTDFGVIGMQICYDLQFIDKYNSFKRLKEKGAEIVFWPSAYCGGKPLNTVAWMNQYVVVSSTRFDPSKICDIDGSEIATTDYRDRHWVCEPVNLEKTMIRRWPHSNKFDDIIRKYGRKIKFKLLLEENWAIVESLSPEVRVADVLKEFDIESFMAQNDLAEEMYKKYRVYP